MDKSVVRHYRRLRSLTWDRADDYPMPAFLALLVARQGVAAQSFDWDECQPVDGRPGWSFTARRDYDDEYAELEHDEYGYSDFVSMYRHAGQSRAVAANFARAAICRVRENEVHTSHLIVQVTVQGPRGERGTASLGWLKYVETDPLAEGYLVADVVPELVAQACDDAALRADGREAAEMERQAVVFAY